MAPILFVFLFHLALPIPCVLRVVSVCLFIHSLRLFVRSEESQESKWGSQLAAYQSPAALRMEDIHLIHLDGSVRPSPLSAVSSPAVLRSQKKKKEPSSILSAGLSLVVRPKRFLPGAAAIDSGVHDSIDDVVVVAVLVAELIVWLFFFCLPLFGRWSSSPDSLIKNLRYSERDRT